MSNQIRSLKPNSIWNHFADINAIPRASKKETKIIAFMAEFGKNLGLETIVDECGNVIIRKLPTKGMENRKPIVLQSHLDMVHQKNDNRDFDFDTQGINMYIDGDWVKADGTTLGADNGIGVATIMAILASDEIPHPALEALFTIDEETGMTGAMGLKSGRLSGDILLNLDTEEDDEITIGCAGGIDVTALRKYQQDLLNASEYTSFKISVKGLQGGHSGIDINRGRGNANKILNRLLYNQNENFGMRLCEFNGGSLRNAIPRESDAVIAIPLENKKGFLIALDENISDIKNEYSSIEKNLEISAIAHPCPSECMSKTSQQAIINSLYGAHNGVFRMSPDIKDLVEASNNIAKVEIKNGVAKILCLTRSSVESSKKDVTNTLKSTFELAGFKVSFTGAYPGWTPNVHSPILKVLSELYKNIHGNNPQIVACHAGLECGILGKNYPEMDMISFGPTIKGAHSPDEKVNISSVEKFWDYTLEILKNIPPKESVV